MLELKYDLFGTTSASAFAQSRFKFYTMTISYFEVIYSDQEGAYLQPTLKKFH